MTFVAWGLFQAFFLITERMMGKKSIYHRLPHLPKVILTNIIVLFGWVLFRAPDINQALAYWKVMLGISGHNDASMMLQAQIMSLPHLFSMLLCAIMVWQPVQAYDWVKNLRGYKYALTGAVFILAIAVMFSQTFNPFLYFQF